MEEMRSQINKNYVAANRFVQEHQCYIFSLFYFYLLLVFIAIIADFALSFSFFSKFHENELGQLPINKYWLVALKAVLPLAVAVCVKFTFDQLPNYLQKTLLVVLLIFCLITAFNIGRSQMRPMLIEALDQIFPEKAPLPKELQALFGENETDMNNDSLYGNKNDGSYGPQEELAIQKSEFKKEFKSYGNAFVLITALGVIAWMRLSKTYVTIKKIKQIRGTVIEPYFKLKQKEEKVYELREKVKYLKLNKLSMYRTFQDVIVKAYMGGLVVPKTNLEDLMIFGDSDGDSKKYPKFQVFIRRWIIWVNTENLSSMIKEADKSIENLSLIDIQLLSLNQDHSKTNNLKALPTIVNNVKEGAL